ncbi:MAG: hypothetical protein P0Y65_16135 [Candidatus Devosia phytovorans]|uniref:EamA domain-containing protein n=1 Tax=Candidatus Devosia phytovorans TaxID=3121372 RepID=A0AAJ5VT64_9HYPH|nr:hypothetical protein [Devosia sp.]WEK03706.1 MAG: hypothetical protein P0Y65_16135 [Devosia sp.]
MYHWILIGLAASANVALNLSLKQMSHALRLTSPGEFILSALLSPWTWASLVSGLVLVGAFMTAVRTFSLSLTYTAVTAIAMVALTVVSVGLKLETVSITRVAGLVLIVAGLVLSARGAA